MVLWGRNVADRVLVIAPTHRSSTIILNFTSLHEAGHAELGVFNDEEIPDLFALSVGVERDIDTLAEVAAYVRERPATWEMQEVIEELHRYGALARFGPSRNAEARQTILDRLDAIAAQVHEHDRALGDSLRSASDGQIHAMAYLLLKRQLPPPRAVALRQCLS